MRFYVAIVAVFITLLSVAADVDYKPSQGEKADAPVRFTTAEVFIDSGANPLAAWQVEVIYDRELVKIVGLEGGEGCFDQPPVYDPKGLAGGRLIVAAFTTDDVKAPSGKIRVARLHLQISGAVDGIKLQLTAACKPGGEKIDATVKLIPANTIKTN